MGLLSNILIFLINFMDQQPSATIPAPVTRYQHTSADCE